MLRKQNGETRPLVYVVLAVLAVAVGVVVWALMETFGATQVPGQPIR